MSKNTLFIIYNFIGFQAVWAACAYGAINQLPSLGAYSALLYITINFLLSKNKALDALVMFFVALIGILLDSLNTFIGIISFIEGSSILPFWLITLWFSFALLLPHSLYWLSKFPLLAVLFGGIGGSGSYFIGHQLGAITLSDPLFYSLGTYFIEWAIIIPASFWFMKYIENILLVKRHTSPT